MPEAGTILSSIITTDMVSGVLNEMISLIPIVIPASITFLGVRKGLSFVFSTLMSA